MKKFKSLCVAMIFFVALTMLAPISIYAAKSAGTIRNNVKVVMEYSDKTTVPIPNAKVGIKGGLLGTKFLLGSDYHECNNEGKVTFKQTSRVTDMYFELPDAWKDKVEPEGIRAKYNAKLMGTFKYYDYNVFVKENKFRVGMPLAWTTVDTTIYLKAKKFEVKFIADGVDPRTAEVEYLRKAEKPNDPKREGYTFDGWYFGNNKFDFDKQITDDITLVGKWKVKKHNVTFKNGDDIKKEVVEYGKKVAKPSDPEKEGHKFLGWYNNENLFDFESEIKDDITLEAKWEINEYTVTFHTAIETMIASQKVKHGFTAQKPEVELEKEGHTFKGWLKAGEEFDFNTPIKDNITLEAKWEINKYKLTFKNTDGTEDVLTGFEHGKKFQENPNFLLFALKPQLKEGFIFKGWADENDMQFTGDTVITRDMILHPTWKLDTKIDSSSVKFYIYNADWKGRMSWEDKYFAAVDEKWGYVSNVSKLVWQTSGALLWKRSYVEAKDMKDSKLYDPEGEELDVKKLVDETWINAKMKDKYKNSSYELRLYRLTKVRDGSIHVDLAFYDAEKGNWVHELD